MHDCLFKHTVGANGIEGNSSMRMFGWALHFEFVLIRNVISSTQTCVPT